MGYRRPLILAASVLFACIAAFLLSMGTAVDSVTAATGFGALSRVEIAEPDGDLVVVTIMGPKNFYYKLYSGQLDPHNPHDARNKAVIATKTNEAGYSSVYIDKATRPLELHVTVDPKRSSGNLKADLVNCNISGDFARVDIKGSVNAMELRGTHYGGVRLTDTINAFTADGNVKKLSLGYVNGSFIATYAGSIGTLHVASNMVGAFVWTGIDRFGGPPGAVGKRDIGTVNVGGILSGSFFYMGPASYGSDFEQPTGRLGKLRVRKLGKTVAKIENTVVVSSNGVKKITATIVSNLVVNGVVTNWVHGS